MLGENAPVENSGKSFLSRKGLLFLLFMANRIKLIVVVILSYKQLSEVP